MIVIHRVQPGDTLYLIAQRYGVSLNSLIELNNPPYIDRLTPGQVLLARVEAAPTRYTVRTGDTLWLISRRFGVTIEAIVALNRLSNPDLIYPGEVLLIPAAGPAPYPARVNSYLVVQGEPDRETVRGAAQALTYLSIFAYSFNLDGSLNRPFDTPARETAGSLGIKTIMTLANNVQGRFDTDLAHTALTDPSVQDRLVGEMLDVISANGFAGLNVDFEYLLPEDREAYNNFMRRLQPLLHSRGLLLSSALAPKVSADQPGLLYEAHDYPVHGALCDYVVLMTYEWGWVGGPPMAIAPLNEVRRVLDYAVTAIPSPKILMGVPIYARDWRIPWQRGTLAETFSVRGAVKRAIDYGVPIEEDTAAQSPFYHYTDQSGQRHEVWLEDALSLNAKLGTVISYQLGGASFWTLPADFPQAWPLTADRLALQK